MRHEPSYPTKQEESEPLFVKFANFQFSNETIDDFFRMLKDEGVDVPLEELFIYYRTEDKEYINGPQSLTGVDKEKILKDLESDQGEFKNLLTKLVVKDKEDKEDKLHFFLDKGNLYCSEVPIQFTYNKKHPGKLDIASPSLGNIEEVGWGNLILGFMAIDLGKYLMENPVTRIRLCKKEDCGKFFTQRGGKAVFCSEACKRLFHYIPRKESGYYRKHIKQGRNMGKYKY